MSKKSPRVDASIKKAPEFAQPILEKLRTIFHKASSEIEENIKWGSPTFQSKGIVPGMAAFKNHVGFGFKKSPPAFLIALKKNKQAIKGFEGSPPGKRRDYIEWITDAKREETRDRRIATAVAWIAEGKSRNWKYEKTNS